MLQQLLLVFIVISGVYCQQVCPTWTALTNNPALTNYLNGQFYKYFGSGVNTSNVEDCQLHTYVSENDHIVNGYIQSATYCNQLTSCTDTQSYHECDLVFLSASPQPPSQSTKIKIFAKMPVPLSSGYCLVTSYCRDSEEGIGVLCNDKPSDLIMFFAQVTFYLASLVNIPLPRLFINQNECKLEAACPP